MDSAAEHVESVLQEADLCHIMAAALAGWGCTVAALYTIAVFDQKPQGLACQAMLSQLRIGHTHW